MNSAQKWIAGLAIAAIAITASFAPYEYTVHNELARLSGDPSTQSSGITHAPLWSEPTKDDFAGPAEGWIEIDAMRLDSGRLLVWWAGIAIIAALTMALAANRSAPHRAQDNA